MASTKYRSTAVGRFHANAPISAVSTSPDHSMAVVAGRDVLSIVRIYTENTGLSLSSLQNHDLALGGADEPKTQATSGHHHAGSGRSSTANKYSMLTQHLNLRIGKINLNYSCTDAAWSPNYMTRQWIATSATNGAVCLWDLHREKDAQKLKVVNNEHKRTVNALSFHTTDGHTLASGSQDGLVKLWDLRSAQSSVATLNGRCESVRSVHFSPLNPYLLASSYDNGSVVVFDIRNPEIPDWKRQAHQGPSFCVRWHPTEKGVLATSGRDRFIRVFKQDACLSTIQTIAPVNKIGWRPSHRYQIAATSLVSDNSFRIWDVRRPFVPQITISAHRDLTTDFAWHQDDGMRPITVGRDSYLLYHSISAQEGSTSLDIQDGLSQQQQQQQQLAPMKAPLYTGPGLPQVQISSLLFNHVAGEYSELDGCPALSFMLNDDLLACTTKLVHAKPARMPPLGLGQIAAPALTPTQPAASDPHSKLSDRFRASLGFSTVPPNTPQPPPSDFASRTTNLLGTSGASSAARFNSSFFKGDNFADAASEVQQNRVGSAKHMGTFGGIQPESQQSSLDLGAPTTSMATIFVRQASGVARSVVRSSLGLQGTIQLEPQKESTTGSMFIEIPIYTGFQGVLRPVSDSSPLKFATSPTSSGSVIPRVAMYKNATSNNSSGGTGTMISATVINKQTNFLGNAGGNSALASISPHLHPQETISGGSAPKSGYGSGYNNGPDLNDVTNSGLDKAGSKAGSKGGSVGGNLEGGSIYGVDGGTSNHHQEYSVVQGILQRALPQLTAPHARSLLADHNQKFSPDCIRVETKMAKLHSVGVHSLFVEISHFYHQQMISMMKNANQAAEGSLFPPMGLSDACLVLAAFHTEHEDEGKAIAWRVAGRLFSQIAINSAVGNTKRPGIETHGSSSLATPLVGSLTPITSMDDQVPITPTQQTYSSHLINTIPPLSTTRPVSATEMALDKLYSSNPYLDMELSSNPQDNKLGLNNLVGARPSISTTSSSNSASEDKMGGAYLAGTPGSQPHGQTGFKTLVVRSPRASESLQQLLYHYADMGDVQFVVAVLQLALLADLSAQDGYKTSYLPHPLHHHQQHASYKPSNSRRNSDRLEFGMETPSASSDRDQFYSQPLSYLAHLKIPVKKQEEWISGYTDLLHLHRLYSIASSLSRVTERLKSISQKSTTVYSSCTQCQKPLAKNTWACQNCSLFTTCCSVCRLPVKGLYVWCQGCSHGGHVGHIREWFTKHSHCPAGCDHKCEYS